MASLEPNPLSTPPTSTGPTESNTPPSSVPPPNLAPKKRGKGLLIFFILLLLIGCGALGYLWYQGRSQAAEANKAKETAQTELAAAQAKVKELETEAESSPKPTTSTSPAVTADADQIKVVVKNTIEADPTMKSGTYTIAAPKISTKDTNFATVGYTVNGQTGGASYMVKKVNGSWVVIISGLQNVPTAAQVKEFGIPSDLQ